MSMAADVAPQNLAMIVMSLKHRLVRPTSPSAALQLLEIVTAFFGFEIARLPVKLEGFSVVLSDPLPLAIHDAEIVTALPIPATAGFLEKGDRLLDIGGDPDPIFIHPAEIDAASHMPAITSFPEKGDRLPDIDGDADPIFIHHAEIGATSHIPAITGFPIEGNRLPGV